jgi:flagellar FliL protein
MAEDKEMESGAEKNGAPAAATGGGFKAFLPLILTLLLMPAVAWAMTQYVLVPRLQKALGTPGHAENADGAGGEKAGGDHGKESGGEKTEKGGGGGGAKQSAPLTKMLVNVSGTMGSRYLMTSVTLVGGGSDFKGRVEKNEARLRDFAMTSLATKTITDLEKPGARNLVRSELITGFNNILGGGAVQELFITEFAIQ